MEDKHLEKKKGNVKVASTKKQLADDLLDLSVQGFGKVLLALFPLLLLLCGHNSLHLALQQLVIEVMRRPWHPPLTR